MDFQDSWMEHLYVKFGDPSWVGVTDIVRKNRQTYRQTDRQTDKRRCLPIPPTAVVVGNKYDC